MPSIYAQLAYWRKHPPVHMLVAAYLDYKPPVDASSPHADASTEASIEALMAMAPEIPEHLKFRIPRNG